MAVGAIIGGVATLASAIFGGGSRVDEMTLQIEEQREQREHELEVMDFQQRQLVIQGAQQRQLTKALLIGGGVVALGAVGTAVVIKG